jgi:hypothetical protein
MGEKMNETPSSLFDNVFLKGPGDVMLLKRNEKPRITAELLCLIPDPLNEWEEWLDKENEAAD